MGNRRFTRLTNGFSKRVENHKHAIALYYWHYNSSRVHHTVKTTPAVAAEITNHEAGNLKLYQHPGRAMRRVETRPIQIAHTAAIAAVTFLKFLGIIFDFVRS